MQLEKHTRDSLGLLKSEGEPIEHNHKQGDLLTKAVQVLCKKKLKSPKISEDEVAFLQDLAHLAQKNDTIDLKHLAAGLFDLSSCGACDAKGYAEALGGNIFI